MRLKDKTQENQLGARVDYDFRREQEAELSGIVQIARPYLGSLPSDANKAKEVVFVSPTNLS